ncbi:MAG: M48 family metallopeptidase, partial [Pseudomonadota bacterium]
RIGRGMGRRLAVWGTGAVASVLVILLVILPAMADTLATFIPRDREVAIGRASLNQISRALGGSRESLTCNGAEGRAALDKMTARLLGDRTLDYDLDVQVFRHKAVNAFAVPGGHVVLFDGLLQAAGSPEEVAGVLGHEIGHVINRDPTRLTLRSAGSVGILGLLFGDFAGGAAVIVVTERLMAASYAQDAERGADRVAHDLLAQAGLPSQPLALFFIKLRDRYGERGGLLSHLASHPDLGSRADAARAADRVGDVPYVPVLSDREWAALKSICAG